MTDTIGRTELTSEQIEYLIERLVRNASDAVRETEEHRDDAFYLGKRFAYYEMLDTLKNQLDIYDQDLKKYGLNFDIDRELLV